MSRPRAVRAGLLLAAAVAVCACRGVAPEAPQEFRAPVAVSRLGTGSVEDVIEASGELRAEEEALLRAEVRGSLELSRRAGRRLREGDDVQAGEVVAYLRGEDALLDARLPAFERRLDEVRARHAAKATLHEQGLISALEFRQSEAELAAAETDLRQARLTSAKTALRAPFGGTLALLARAADGTATADGQRVEPGFLVASVVRLGTLVGQLSVPSSKAIRVAPGQPARLRHHGYEQRVFAGRVARVAPVIDVATRTARVEVELANAERVLRPGMFVRAELVVERREGVLVLPRPALLERGGRPVAFVLDGSRVVQRELVLGVASGELIEVRAGLRAGEEVVVRGHETLADGSLVRVAVDP